MGMKLSRTSLAWDLRDRIKNVVLIFLFKMLLGSISESISEKSSFKKLHPTLTEEKLRLPSSGALLPSQVTEAFIYFILLKLPPYLDLRRDWRKYYELMFLEPWTPFPWIAWSSKLVWTSNHQWNSSTKKLRINFWIFLMYLFLSNYICAFLWFIYLFTVLCGFPDYIMGNGKFLKIPAIILLGRTMIRAIDLVGPIKMDCIHVPQIQWSGGWWDPWTSWKCLWKWTGNKLFKEKKKKKKSKTVTTNGMQWGPNQAVWFLLWWWFWGCPREGYHMSAFYHHKMPSTHLWCTWLSRKNDHVTNL